LLKTDALDQWANFELSLLMGDNTTFITSSRNDAQTIIDIAFDYAEAGFYTEAVSLIELHHEKAIQDCVVPNPMRKSIVTTLILAWLSDQIGNKEQASKLLESTAQFSHDYVFPSRINEQLVFEWAAQNTSNSVVSYGLGNYYFNLKRHDDAIAAWQEAAKNGSKYATLYRNLGIALWNKRGEGETAREYYTKAVEFAPNDMRIQFEFDQLKKKLNDSPAQRLKDLELFGDQVLSRDDFSVELAALLNFDKRYNDVLHLFGNRSFHPWEGGEGQVLKQYTHACLKLGQLALKEGDAKKALDFFQKSVNTPDNLGEKYHPLQAVAHINYWKGMAHKALNNAKDATKCFLLSAEEEGDFVDMAVSAYSELTYYSALSLRELQKEKEASQFLGNLKKFAQESSLLPSNLTPNVEKKQHAQLGS
jgi:tetratricopeptide (TPR) repeat protein